MGLTKVAGYTGRMTPATPLLLQSGDLSICPERGEVRNSRGESTRLGPVNMKVLALLMNRSGHVVSRADILDTVWKNQVVSDDTLTRAVSDLRAEVGRLSEHDDLIETVPKRGYRWTVEVREAAAGLRPVEERRLDAAPTAQPDPKAANPRRLFFWGGRAVAYLVAILLIASLAVWLMNELSRPARRIVAVLPTITEAASREFGAGIDQQLAGYLIGLDRIDLLSRSAIESRPSNPFPYFYYQFGASWLIESELRTLAQNAELTVELVDARTGIVLLQSTVTMRSAGPPSAADIEPAMLPLTRFFESQAGR